MDPLLCPGSNLIAHSNEISMETKICCLARRKSVPDNMCPDSDTGQMLSLGPYYKHCIYPLPEPVAQSVKLNISNCRSEGMGFEPHSGQSKVRLFSLSILTDKIVLVVQSC
jgi:hypothetical protein